MNKVPISHSEKQSRTSAGHYPRLLRNRLYCTCSHYFDLTLLSTSWINLFFT